MTPSMRLDEAILGMTVAELKEWHAAYAYRVAFDSINSPRCREVWERVGRAILRAEGVLRQ